MLPLDGVHQQEMVHTMKTVAVSVRPPRRQHDRSFKAKLVAQCLVPGASVAAVALAAGVNANLLFKWRSDYLRSKLTSGKPPSSAVLVPVGLKPGVGGELGDSRPLATSTASTSVAMTAQRDACASGVIELDIAGAVLRLRGPIDETSLCSVLRALRHSA